MTDAAKAVLGPTKAALRYPGFANTPGPPPPKPSKAGSAIDPVGVTSPYYSVDDAPGTGPSVWADYPPYPPEPTPAPEPPPDPGAAAFLRAIMPPLDVPATPPVIDFDALALETYQDMLADGDAPVFGHALDVPKGWPVPSNDPAIDPHPVFHADKVAEIAFPAPLAAEDAAEVEAYLARRHGVVECPP